MFTDKEKFEITRAYRDASRKCGELKARQKDEFQQAEAENREPIEITPLTEIRANLLFAVIQSIKEVPTEISEVVGVQRRASESLGESQLYLLSNQLLAILLAAGFGGPDAQVPGQPGA
jgi:hypothetical protein